MRFARFIDTHNQLLFHHTAAATLGKVQHTTRQRQRNSPPTALATHYNCKTCTLQQTATQRHRNSQRNCYCNTLQPQHLVHHAATQRHRNSQSMLLQHTATATPGTLQQTATQRHRNSQPTALATQCNCNTWETATDGNTETQKLTSNCFCNTLQLQHMVHCNTLPHSCRETHDKLILLLLTIHWIIGHIVLQCVAVCCSVLQCVAVCCIALQCVATLKKKN